jgi:predicted RNase H-like HicB family nuclease
VVCLVTINKSFKIKEEAFEGDIDRFISIPENHNELLRKAEAYRQVKYKTTVNKLPNGEWLAEHPELPGCRIHGKTPEEAKSRLEEVKISWIYAALAEGCRIPKPSDVLLLAETN